MYSCGFLCPAYPVFNSVDAEKDYRSVDPAVEYTYRLRSALMLVEGVTIAELVAAVGISESASSQCGSGA